MNFLHNTHSFVERSYGVCKLYLSIFDRKKLYLHVICNNFLYFLPQCTSIDINSAEILALSTIMADYKQKGPAIVRFSHYFLAISFLLFLFALSFNPFLHVREERRVMRTWESRRVQSLSSIYGVYAAAMASAAAVAAATLATSAAFLDSRT